MDELSGIHLFTQYHPDTDPDCIIQCFKVQHWNYEEKLELILMDEH